MAAGSLQRSRIESIDLLRGVIIVIMALDHSRDFFGSLSSQPTDLATTTAALFFTRWITHLCAPVFFLLAGTSAALTLRRMSKPALARFLLTRGLWLIFLDAVVMRFALQFNVDYQVTLLVVLWALGWAMIVLAGLIWLPRWLVAAFGLALIAGHNTLDTIDAAQFGAWAPLWHLLHQSGPLFAVGDHLVFAGYVLVPWIGVTAMGYVLGAAYEWPDRARRSLLLWLGVALVIGFVALRWWNVYGDPLPWSAQQTPLFTLMSFLNTNKYPPSLLYLMMTLGPALLLLRLFERGVPALLRPAHVIGRVPLFFYIVHFYLIHALAVVACWMRYGTVANIFQSPDLAHFPFTAPPGWDFGLPVVYLVWGLVVVSLYPLCKWFADVRQRRDWWWLSYL
ncbi:DUF1624 domain-containing protein [Dyella sp. 2RAB6]|uniref:DUF1624 domain-containing protein n=1 Tax=Dyella sp. 2RAB6 TaxID=3232992 RepID=UPI003F8F055F